MPHIEEDFADLLCEKIKAAMKLTFHASSAVTTLRKEKALVSVDPKFKSLARGVSLVYSRKKHCCR